jgi:hypothetical protein
VIRFLIRLFSYLFSLGLGLLCFLLGTVALLAGASTMQLEMIPWWSGVTLARGLAAGGLFGILASLRAMRGRWKLLLLLWNLVIFGTLAYGYYYSAYRFEGWTEFRQSLWFTGASAISLLGSISQLSRRR